MEPVTHVLTGACLARAGFNRRAAYATLTMAVAAEMPDIDTVWSWRGPVEGFAHHRGITHTFVGLPIEAGILVGAVWGLHRWRVTQAATRKSGTQYSSKPLTEAPVRWWVLYGCALIGLLSHLLLDYTNNYGLRPFYPFDPRWYAASIAFIFDPVIFALLLFALVVPAIFGLVSSEVGEKERPFRGRGLAIAALLSITLWLGLRSVEHANAVRLALQQTYELQGLPVDEPVERKAASASTVSDAATSPVQSTAPVFQETELVQPPSELLQAQRVVASPEPIDPLRWAVAIDYGPLYQLANVDLRNGSVTANEVTYPKPSGDAAERAAEGSPLGRAYLDWSAMPIITEDQPVVGSSGRQTRRVVLRDPRFMGDVSWLRIAGTTPLTAVMTVNDNGVVVRQTMDGRREPAGHGPVYETHWTLPWLGSEQKVEVQPVLKPLPLPVKHTAIVPKIDLPEETKPAPKQPAPVVSSAPQATPEPTETPAPKEPGEVAPSVPVAVPVAPKAEEKQAVAAKEAKPARAKVAARPAKTEKPVVEAPKPPPHPIILPQ